MATWVCRLELNEDRTIAAGGGAALCDSIRSGGDLRVGTEFRYNEHIEVNSRNSELIREFVDFRITYLLDDRWTAGICNLRVPVELPHGFGPRESMSFFLYNQNGQQAIARPYLDGKTGTGAIGPCPVRDHSEMPKYNELDNWDEQTNAPSSNFIYDFGFYRYCVCDRWEEVLCHEADGTVTSGAIGPLVEAFADGCEVKVAIRGLCADLAAEPDNALDHEVFVHLGSCYYRTDSNMFIGAAQPLVRVMPAIPLVYRSRGWDFGWVLPRTDGHVGRWLCDPYTLTFRKSSGQYPIRWFVGR